jgi:hypothetical protein
MEIRNPAWRISSRRAGDSRSTVAIWIPRWRSVSLPELRRHVPHGDLGDWASFSASVPIRSGANRFVRSFWASGHLLDDVDVGQELGRHPV